MHVGIIDVFTTGKYLRSRVTLRGHQVETRLRESSMFPIIIPAHFVADRHNRKSNPSEWIADRDSRSTPYRIPYSDKGEPYYDLQVL